MELKIFQELGTGTPISWWNDNRSKINDIIKRVNDWQIDDDFSAKRAKGILARIESLREYGRDHSFFRMAI